MRRVIDDSQGHSDLTEVVKDRVDFLEGGIDLLARFGTCQDDLSRHEDQKYYLGLDHAVYQSREKLWFVRGEVVMLDSQPFEPNRELDIAGPNDVLSLEIQETCIEPKLLDDPRIFPTG